MSEAFRLDEGGSKSGKRQTGIGQAGAEPSLVPAHLARNAPGDLDVWLRTHALPLWLDAGICRQSGVCEEALCFEGRSAGFDYTRLRVQARQIYVYSRAVLEGAGEECAQAADLLFDGLVRHGWDDAGGFVHTLARGGGVQNDMRDLYDHAFVLFALAWHYRASGESAALDWAHKTQAFLDAYMKPASGPGYLETPDGDLPRRQNPHMHLFEAYLALAEATGDAIWFNAAQSIYELFVNQIWDRKSGFINEYFNAAWQVQMPEAHPPYEPGHHFEWVWLLHTYERLMGQDVSFVIRRVFNAAMLSGRDRETGFAMDYMDERGPVGESRRLWPQAELVRALKLLRPAEGEIMQERLCRDYLSTPKQGLWIDRWAGDTITARHVPASTLYHLLGIVWD